VYCFDEIEGCINWSELLLRGKNQSEQNKLEERKEKVLPQDLATIIHTSGTTGTPKGVMLSHQNLVSNVHGIVHLIPFPAGKGKALSFLTVCHIFERTALYLYLYYGFSVYFGESIEKISDNLKEVKPTMITAVPRLVEKVYDKIDAKGKELTGIKKKLFFWAIALGLQFEPFGTNDLWYELQLKVARQLIFSKWKEGLSGNLELIVTGRAALQPRLTRIFAAAEIPMLEGYGLTETSPVISANNLKNKGFRLGTIGKLIEFVALKIAEDGDILCKGPNVMMGYFKEEKLPNEVLIDSYFHTGDIGT
jgi:long-chain acyl-CoA synthetase